MSDHRILIAHEDGRAYSVTPAAYRDIYESEGFQVTGPETRASLVPDVPPRARRGRRPTEEPIEQQDDEPEVEPETETEPAEEPVDGDIGGEG